MKHTNPSLKMRPHELNLIEQEILSLHKKRFGNTKLEKLLNGFRLNKCRCDILRHWDHDDICEWIIKMENGLFLKYLLKDALKTEDLKWTI